MYTETRIGPRTEPEEQLSLQEQEQIISFITSKNITGVARGKQRNSKNIDKNNIEE